MVVIFFWCVFTVDDDLYNRCMTQDFVDAMMKYWPSSSNVYGFETAGKILQMLDFLAGVDGVDSDGYKLYKRNIKNGHEQG